MRIVATFALAAALAGQAGEAGAQADTFLSELKAACREEWGTDYQMVEYCQNKQIEAMNAVARIQAEVRSDATLLEILTNCMSEWPQSRGFDWQMVEYCYGKQFEAFKRLQ